MRPRFSERAGFGWSDGLHRTRGKRCMPSTALPSAKHVPPRATTAPTPSLLYWRMQRGLIQVQLADISGVDRATIQRLEAGGEARLSTISKLAAALGVTPAQLQAESPRV